MFMVLAIINQRERVPDILEAWDTLGAPGITILESTGLGSLRSASGIRDDIPLMPSLSEMFRRQEHRHRTLFTVVDEEEMVDKMIAAVVDILGDLEGPRNGVLFVLPVLRAVGLAGAKSRAQK
ncbi:MAG: P-II family nitrogen regulator [Candidatus Promineifilaceae bacterium]|nr:P-II family nitrogen regulator [Candidatus Promineifilaceae bacterium]